MKSDPSAGRPIFKRYHIIVDVVGAHLITVKCLLKPYIYHAHMTVIQDVLLYDGNDRGYTSMLTI